MTDFRKNHPSYMTEKQQREVIEKHLGSGQSFSTAAGSEYEEFACIWFEAAQEWVVVFPDGKVLRGDKPWGAVGYAANAAFEHTGRGEYQWYVESGNGSYFGYEKDEEYWHEGPYNFQNAEIGQSDEQPTK